MTNLHNIEKSGFHHGEYIGYGAGTVWAIRRIFENDGWKATTCGDVLHPIICAKTLSELSAKLLAL